MKSKIEINRTIFVYKLTGADQIYFLFFYIMFSLFFNSCFSGTRKLIINFAFYTLLWITFTTRLKSKRKCILFLLIHDDNPVAIDHNA